MLVVAAAVLSLQPTELSTTAFAPPTASIYRRAGRCRQRTSSLPSSVGRSGGSGSSDSGDFSFNDLQQELSKRRAEEAAAAAATAAGAAAEEAAAAAGTSRPGLEEGNAFMEEQMVSLSQLCRRR